MIERLAAAVADRSLDRYPFQLGLPEFREAIADFMHVRFGVEVDPYREVLPLLGSKEGLGKLPFAFLDAGDRALVPDPGYAVYRGGVTLAGGDAEMVPLRHEDGFLLDLDRIESTPRTKLLYLNYPNNPTAASASLDYFGEAVRRCRENGVVLVHDNAYSEVAFDGYRPPSVLEVDGARDVAIEFHSLSKTFNVTGWRIGWAVGSAGLISTLSRVKSFLDTGVYLGMQAAGAEALRVRESWLPGSLELLRERRDAGVDALHALGFEAQRPRATMYLWAAVPEGGKGGSEAFALRALEEQGVVIMPGAALGAGGEGWFRLALTVGPARMGEAVERLGRIR
jgi:LL-diaminopimelate aminotransferase